MSKISDLKARIHAFDEIRSIISAMKNLSIVELNKVSHLQNSLGEMAGLTEEALEVFEGSFELPLLRRLPGKEPLYILLGSERGFCGGFNEAVIARFEQETAQNPDQPKILAVGRKIGAKLEGDPRLIGIVDGPSTTEEIPGIITRLAGQLENFPEHEWALIHRMGDESTGKTVVIDPFKKKLGGRGKNPTPYPPLLNLAPEELYPKLFEQYLFSILYRAFYFSFLEENHERLRHMEGALDSLEKNLVRLRGEQNILRQEEITEELEIILLGTEGKDGYLSKDF